MSENDVHGDANDTAAMAAQLTQANERIARMSEELTSLQIEQKLTHKLATAGAIDLEAAVLVARSRIEGKADADVDRCVAQLRKEKGYLFSTASPIVVPRKTAPAKDRVTHNQAVLEQAAKRAARSGSRVDLQRYLVLRRSVM
jgi:hypothetical protein